MSEKGGKILYDLWMRIDQADFDLMVRDAFHALPTKIQKKFIGDILHQDSWDLSGKPDDKTLEAYRKYASIDGQV